MSKNHIALQNRFLDGRDSVYDRLAGAYEAAGRITGDTIRHLAEELRLPVANIRAVAHFYDELMPTEAEGVRVRLCNGEACTVAGGKSLRAHFEQGLSDTADTHVGEVTCLGFCGSGPNVLIEGAGRREVRSLPSADATEQLLAGVLDGFPTVRASEPTNVVHLPTDGRPNLLMGWFVDGDATSVGAARQAGVYDALVAALTRPPQAIIDEVVLSQLRGRGGAGFPTGRKLQTVRDAPSARGDRYVVVNADEGDAGAFIDKELLERAPHTVIEGTVLMAYAVGASDGLIYLRGEYPRALEVFGAALAAARGAGFLGRNILGTGFDFEITLVRGHGAYVCGEETSLLRSLEGVPAQVTPKPPYPAEEGLRGAPTAVNNVETIANLPFIVANGGATFAAFGFARSRGTKLVSLNTAVVRPGLYEVELGTTIRQVIFDLAGGMSAGHLFKAVQIGGPLGGIFGAQHLDLPLDFEALAEAGGTLGHAGMVVYPGETDLVEIGRGLMKFCAVESCGKCFPCRLGSVRGTELFDKILEGRGEQADLELLAELSETMRLGSLCALGGAVPVPIDNLLTWFIDELRCHIPGAEVPELLRERAGRPS